MIGDLSSIEVGKKAAAFSIAFAFILPNYFFMTKVLNWF